MMSLRQRCPCGCVHENEWMRLGASAVNDAEILWSRVAGIRWLETGFLDSQPVRQTHHMMARSDPYYRMCARVNVCVICRYRTHTSNNQDVSVRCRQGQTGSCSASGTCGGWALPMLMINGCSSAPAKYLFCKSKASLDCTASTFTITT